MKNQKFGTKLLMTISLILIFTSLLISIITYEVTSSILEENLLTYSDEYLAQLSRNLENAQENLDDDIFDSIIIAGLLNRRTLNRYMKTDNNVDDLEFAKLVSGILASGRYVKAINIRTVDGDSYFQKEHNEVISQKALEDAMAKYADKASVMRHFSGKYLVVVRPLYDLSDTRLLGHIAIVIDQQYLLDEFSHNLKYKEWGIVVLDENHGLLAAQDQVSERIFNEISDEIPLTGKAQIQFESTGVTYISNVLTSPKRSFRVMNIIPFDTMKEASRKLMVTIIWISLGALVINLVIATIISRGFARNLGILVDRIRRFKEGDFDTKVAINTNDEIGIIAEEFNDMAKEINHLVHVVYQEQVLKEKARKEAIRFEYNALQAKMNPHFLYNVLESINSMAKIEGNGNISEVVCILGELLRESIGDDRSNVFLEDELAYVDKYIKLKQITSKNSVEVVYDIDEMLLGAVVPKFILQPVVENAIVHGFRKMDKKGLLKVACFLEDQHLIVTISDNGQGFNPLELLEPTETNEDRWQRTRIGINSIDKRLKIMYGESFGITITSEISKGSEVRLLMPYNTSFAELEGEADV